MSSFSKIQSLKIWVIENFMRVYKRHTELAKAHMRNKRRS
jgi:hypothetical protein